MPEKFIPVRKYVAHAIKGKLKNPKTLDIIRDMVDDGDYQTRLGQLKGTDGSIEMHSIMVIYLEDFLRNVKALLEEYRQNKLPELVQRVSRLSMPLGYFTKELLENIEEVCNKANDVTEKQWTAKILENPSSKESIAAVRFLRAGIGDNILFAMAINPITLGVAVKKEGFEIPRFTKTELPKGLKQLHINIQAALQVFLVQYGRVPSAQELEEIYTSKQFVDLTYLIGIGPGHDTTDRITHSLTDLFRNGPTRDELIAQIQFRMSKGTRELFISEEVAQRIDKRIESVAEKQKSDGADFVGMGCPMAKVREEATNERTRNGLRSVIEEVTRLFLDGIKQFPPSYPGLANRGEIPSSGEVFALAS